MPQNVSETSNLGPWIISAIALIQVWVIALYKKIKKANLSVYESGNIEIGFSNLGPTIGLLGTLAIDNKDLFIREMRLKLTKKKDNASHDFTWKAFRANTIELSTDQPTTLEIAASFLLKKEYPYKYNIVFVEESYISEINPKVAPIPKKWLDFRKEQYNSLKKEGTINISQENIDMFDEIMLEKFIKSGNTTIEYTELDRSFYWDACEYDLELLIETPDAKKNHRKTFSFKLSQEQVNQLRLNVVSIIHYLCGFNKHWYFSYVEYLKQK